MSEPTWRKTGSVEVYDPHPNNEDINLVFLGCGFATRLHSKTLSRFQNVNLYYASRESERAEHYNSKYHGAGAFSSYEQAVASDRVNTILIATPPSLHKDLAISALRAGKHVIVEKPPFLSSAEFDAAERASMENSRCLFVAENYFYKPLARKMRKLLSSDTLGEQLFIHVNALKEQRTSDWRSDAGLAGAGALFEGGIHWINFMANLGYEIESVQGFYPGPKKDLEQSILIVFKYREGPVGILYYSWETPSLFKGLRLSKIYGKKGSISFESNGLFLLVRGNKTRVILPGLRDIAGYRAMFQDFFRALRTGNEPEFGIEKAKRDLGLVESVYRSLK